MPTKPSWYVIFNPAGAGRRAARRRTHLENCLQRAGIHFQLTETTAEGHAEQIAATAYREGWRQFAIAGGDGSAHEVVNGLLGAITKPLPSDVTLAILPMGSGNDLARGLGVPKQLAAACELLRSGRSVPHDVGQVRLQRQGKTDTRYFINAAGTGFDSHLLPLVHGRSGGRWRYFWALLRGIQSFSAPELCVSTEKLHHRGRALVAFVSIGPYLGGGLPICPQAKHDDGLFDITVIENLRALRIIANLPRLLTGRLAGSRWVKTGLSAQVTITCDTEIEADGELLGRGPAHFELLKGAVQVQVRR